MMTAEIARRLDADRFAERFWQRDGTLWSRDAETVAFVESFLGWIDIAAVMTSRVPEIEATVAQAAADGFRHLVVCGMGGSSLCSLVLRQFAPQGGVFEVSVLDSTNAVTVDELTNTLDLDRTLFLVASKSGTTIEPKAFEEHFYHLVKERSGAGAGRQFIAITDPGTPMEADAHARGYRKVFLNFADIGGRYSVLSYFGMVTAAFLGYNVSELLASAGRITAESDRTVHGSDAFGLGVQIAALAQSGRDKLTFVTSPRLSAFGLWAEQLIAESTGKLGMGILPIAEEPMAAPGIYGKDRAFVGVADGDDTIDLTALASAGHPTMSRRIDCPEDLGYEFYAWEVATATAGAILGINPFDQPNVQEAKDLAKAMLAQVAAHGSLPEGPSITVDAGFDLFRYGTSESIASVSDFFSGASTGDYVAILAYLPESDSTTAAIQRLRLSILERTGCGTTFGYGPRYLHSTGQFHKGGPKNGLFLILTDPDEAHVLVPGMGFDFATLCRAQAIGDCQALAKHGQRVIRVHFREAVTADLIETLRLHMSAVSTR